MLRVLVLALLVVPLAAAHGDAPLDVDVHLSRDAAATVTGEGAALLDETPGEEARLTLNLTKDYTTFDVRVDGWDVARVRQVLPLLLLDRAEPVCATAPGTCDYPLFEAFPNEAIWDVDGPARVFHAGGTADAVVLRLGVPGPVNATLVLRRDVTPPAYTLRPAQNVTEIGFYQESTTDELALADLQVRAKGETEWIQNPTPVYHYLQRFPVQGLDPATEHEVRFVFVDWSGNEATSPTSVVRTADEPARPAVTVVPLGPAPNATVQPEGVVLRASWSSPDSPVRQEGVRVFFDKREVTPEVGFGTGEVAYAIPGALARGLHSVSVEVINEAGGRGLARWSFEVGNDVPAAAWAAPFALAAAAGLARRGRP